MINQIPSPVSGTVEEVLVDEGTVAVVEMSSLKLMHLMQKKCKKVMAMMRILRRKRTRITSARRSHQPITRKRQK